MMISRLIKSKGFLGLKIEIKSFEIHLKKKQFSLNLNEILLFNLKKHLSNLI